MMIGMGGNKISDQTAQLLEAASRTVWIFLQLILMVLVAAGIALIGLVLLRQFNLI